MKLKFIQRLLPQQPTAPPNTTLIDLISVSVVFAISVSKATPTAISERVNSALLVDCTSVAEFKSTAFGFGETKVYTATFTPTANSTTTGTILVASDKFSDAAGNINGDGADVNNSLTLRPFESIELKTL
jgi:hypothetical protein